VGSSLGFFGENSSVAVGIISGVVMLLGIVMGALYQRISKKNRKISILKEFRATVSSSQFWASLCISPLIFFLTYSLTKDDPMKLSSLVLSFENGFFCQAIFKELLANKHSESSA